MKTDQWPSWRYGPNGASGVFESEADVPNGWKDHPSKVEKGSGAESGTKTAIASPNGPRTTAAAAAQTTDAKSQTHTDPAKSATAGVGGSGTVAPETAAKGAAAVEADKGGAAADLDAHGHPWTAGLHAATQGKTKDGLWRMAVGKARPAPVEGYPKPAPLDL